MVEKRIFGLSPIEKSWSDQTMRLAAILVFRRYGCRLHRNLAVEFTFFKQYDAEKPPMGDNSKILFPSCLLYTSDAADE